MSTLKILILDDLGERHSKFIHEFSDHPDFNVELTHCFCVQSAQWRLENFEFDILFLDHDLHLLDLEISGGEKVGIEQNGETFARWLASHSIDMFEGLPKVIIHSVNEDGAGRMSSILKKASFEVHILPFDEDLFSKLDKIIIPFKTHF